MKLSALLVSLLACLPSLFSQPFKIPSSWKIVSIKSLGEEDLPDYEGQVLHFLKDGKVIVENENGYYITQYKSRYNYHVLYHFWKIDFQENQNKQLTLTQYSYEAIKQLEAKLAPTERLPKKKSKALLAYASKTQMGDIPLQGYFYRFDKASSKFNYLRFLTDSTITTCKTGIAPYTIGRYLDPAYLKPTELENYTMITPSILAVTEKVDSKQLEGPISSSTYYHFLVDSLRVNLIRHTGKDTISNEWYDYSYSPSKLLNQWLPKDDSISSSSQALAHERLLIRSSAIANDTTTTVEEMPRFPGCENLPYEERKICADKKLLEHIYRNIIYPDEAKRKGIEGTVVVQFNIETDGTMTDINIIKDIGGGCGLEAVRVVNSMTQQGIRWIPGKVNTEPVSVKFSLPVMYRLE